jgi:hypothetical protein
MPRTRAQAKIAVACSPCGAEASLLRLPMETRLQIYGIVLLADFSGGDKGRAPDKPDDAVDNDAASGEPYNEVGGSSSQNHDHPQDPLPSTQQPTHDNRQAYSQLLLVCKMIHAEAAPLFYSRVTFFMTEPFKFANTFLRRLPAYKITSIRHLELRLVWWDFGYVNYKVRSKVLNDLATVFKTYRELTHLDSLTLTMRGRLQLVGRWNRRTAFYPLEADCGMYYTSEEIMNSMREAGRALADMIAIAELDILEHVGYVPGTNTPVENIISGIAIASVKVRRKE